MKEQKVRENSISLLFNAGKKIKGEERRDDNEPKFSPTVLVFFHQNIAISREQESFLHNQTEPRGVVPLVDQQEIGSASMEMIKMDDGIHALQDDKRNLKGVVASIVEYLPFA